jgi:V/A-type H+-transporting ATPase subunit D
MADTAATRSAALALADERTLMRQGHQFLDEKRMLLAAELLRGLRAHQAQEAVLLADVRSAAATLRAALQRHGLQGLQAYPAAVLEPAAPTLKRDAFLGVARLQAAYAPRARLDASRAVDASPEAQAAANAFAALLGPLAALAASAGSLLRLAAEYRRTERRARALENVLLPEVQRALAAIDELLEQGEQEEAVRIRQAARRQREP